MDLKIFVTHTSNKNDEVIENRLYTDVVAGAVNQRLPMPEGFVGDNTGTNISEKNKYYCELSTQYWAWKNVDAEYYGFCHYRRYMTLSGKDYSGYGESTRRGQINAEILSPRTASMFGLDNPDEMEKYVKDYDIILPLEQDLSKLQTCQGIKKDVYGHFAGHDRMFMHAPDLDLLIELIDRLFPDYSEDAHKFMKQSFFWGFNCFVMRKELFQELCEFEFTILEEMEKHIDNTYYNRQQSRIYGFMAEILSCLFFYHVKKTRSNVKFGETQLIYFEHTGKITKNEPENKDAVNIVFDLSGVEFSPYYFSVGLNSFVESMNPNTKYNVILAHRDLPQTYINDFTKTLEGCGNVSVQEFNWKNTEYELSDCHLNIDDCRTMLPWILTDYDKVLVLPWNAIYTDSVDGVYGTDMGGVTIVATCDPLHSGYVRAVNPGYENYLQKYLGVNEHGIMFSVEAYIIDLRQARKKLSKENFIFNHDKKRQFTYGELMNCVYKNDWKMIPMCNVRYFTEDTEEIKTINQSPLSIADDYVNTKKATVQIFSAGMLGSVSGTQLSLELRERMDKSKYHSYFNAVGVYVPTTGGFKSKAMSKIDGGFKCIQDHGFWYTVGYAFRKPFIK